MSMTAEQWERVRSTGIRGPEGAFPLPVPNGWFAVATSAEVPPGHVHNAHYFGRDLVVFRTEAGEPCVLDAYCPHLGAHLGVGAGAPESVEPGPGKVVGDCIECPFHGWRFDRTGSCVEIPYGSGRVPPQARVRGYPTVERAGLIFAWHHLHDEPPGWELPHLEEHGHPDWVGPVVTDRHIATSLQDVTENDQDTVHFVYVHGAEEIPRQETEFSGRIRRTVGIRPDGSEMIRETHQLGFGILRVPGLVTFVFASSPVDAEHTHQRWVFHYPRAVGDDVGRATIDAFAKSGIYQDIPIWNHKWYRAKPLLVDGDGPILQYRRWARQFYSDI